MKLLGRPTPREPHPNEIRDQLANLRTFLAWVRTAITIMAFGFVVAKFGLLLHEIHGANVHPHELRFSTFAGVTLVLLGAVFLVLALLDYLAVRRQIEQQIIAFSARIPVLLAAVLIVIAIGMAAYIWLTGSLA